jgi:hypothetical protein
MFRSSGCRGDRRGFGDRIRGRRIREFEGNSAGGALNSEKPSWVAFPFGFGFGKGGPLFALCVVADLQVGAFAFRGFRITSLKAGHYIGDQSPSPPEARQYAGCNALGYPVFRGEHEPGDEHPQPIATGICNPSLASCPGPTPGRFHSFHWFCRAG